jgi:hypothetical protein
MSYDAVPPDDPGCEAQAAANHWHPELGGGEMRRTETREAWDDVIEDMIRASPRELRGPMRRLAAGS